MPNIGMDSYTADMAWGFGGPASVGAEALYRTLTSDPEILKALEVTGTLPPTGPGFDALRVEDLTPTLASAEIQERQLYLWRDMPKAPAYDTVVQGSRVDRSNTNYRMTGFVGSNSSGYTSGKRFTRYTQEIKFMAIRGNVHIVPQLIRSVTTQGIRQNAAMQTSEELDTLTMLKLIERNLAYADSSVHSSEFDGIFKQIQGSADTNNSIILDLRGDPPDKDLLENLTNLAAQNSASPTHFHLPNPVRRDLRQALFPSVRTEEGYEGIVGMKFDKYMLEALGGDYETLVIRRNMMLTPGVPDGIPWKVPTDASENAPNAPSAVSGVAAAHTALAYQPGIETAGTYYYSVESIGEGGGSLTTSSTGVVVTAAQKVTLSITCTDSNVLFYNIYRNKMGESGVSTTNRYFLARVGRSGNTTTYTDNGGSLPDTSSALYMTLKPNEIRWRQLLPIMKRTLPIGMMDDNYAILLFGALEIPVPKHHIWVKNVGKRAQSGVAAL